MLSAWFRMRAIQGDNQQRARDFAAGVLDHMGNSPDAEEEEGELGEPPPGSTTSRGGKERQFPCDEDAVSASALELVVENNERSLL